MQLYNQTNKQIEYKQMRTGSLQAGRHFVFGDLVPTVASDSCSSLKAVEPVVVLCSFASGFLQVVQSGMVGKSDFLT